MLDAASACGGRTGTGRVRQGCLCHDPYADRIEQAMAVAAGPTLSSLPERARAPPACHAVALASLHIRKGVSVCNAMIWIEKYDVGNLFQT